MYINDRNIKNLCKANLNDMYKQVFKDRWNCETPYSEMGLADIESEEQVDGNSLELKLDTVFQFDSDCTIGFSYDKPGQNKVVDIDVTKGYSIDLRKLIKGVTSDANLVSVHIPAGAKFLCQSREFIQIPLSLIGFIYVRSSYARVWINHLTSQVIKPTFCGHLTFEFINHSNDTQVIKLSDPIIQLMLAQCEIPEIPYCLGSKSRYQNQKNQLNKVSIL